MVRTVAILNPGLVMESDTAKVKRQTRGKGDNSVFTFYILVLFHCKIICFSYSYHLNLYSGSILL